MSHDNPVTYVFVATHAASGRKVMASFGTSAQLIEIVPEICFDNNALGLYNPLKGEALHSQPLSQPLLLSGEMVVA